MNKRERTLDILVLIHDFGGEADLDQMASRLEDDQPDLEHFLQMLEEEGLVERAQDLDEITEFRLTRKGRRRLEGQRLEVKSTESREAYLRRLEELGLRRYPCHRDTG